MPFQFQIPVKHPRKNRQEQEVDPIKKSDLNTTGTNLIYNPFSPNRTGMIVDSAEAFGVSMAGLQERQQGSLMICRYSDLVQGYSWIQTYLLKKFLLCKITTNLLTWT
jgi:hypothetical protein